MKLKFIKNSYSFIFLIICTSILFSNILTSKALLNSETVNPQVAYEQKTYTKTLLKSVIKTVYYPNAKKNVNIKASWQIKIKIKIKYSEHPNTCKIGTIYSYTMSIVNPYISNDLDVATFTPSEMKAIKTSDGLYIKYSGLYKLTAKIDNFAGAFKTVTFGPYEVSGKI